MRKFLLLQLGYFCYVTGGREFRSAMCLLVTLSKQPSAKSVRVCSYFFSNVNMFECYLLKSCLKILFSLKPSSFAVVVSANLSGWSVSQVKNS